MFDLTATSSFTFCAAAHVKLWNGSFSCRLIRLSRGALREHDRPIRKLNFPTEAEAEILSRVGAITQPLKQGGGEEDALDEEGRTAGGKGGDEDRGGKEAETRTSRYVGELLEGHLLRPSAGLVGLGLMPRSPSCAQASHGTRRGGSGGAASR